MIGFELYVPTISKALILAFSVVGLSVASMSSSAHAVDSNPADGWESPSKLKPYVKLPADGAAVAPSTTAVSETSGTLAPVGTIEKRVSDPNAREIDAAVKSIILDGDAEIRRLRKDRKAAKRLAKYHWLDKAAEANPRIIEAITMHRSAAKILANHPRLAQVAEADHYVCRRITKWKDAARVLAKNGEVKEVAALDPEGLYVAIKRDKKIIRILSRNPIFDQMIVENPDLARVISKYM